MGRRPNQRVLEYFDRGAKLDDNSNRYEHRCKACGEPFPKGRIETLVAHIEKRCPSIRRSNDEQVSCSVNHPSDAGPIVNETSTNPFEKSNGLATANNQLALPVIGRQSFRSGLEALAEASRQLEHPAKAGIDSASNNQLIDPNLGKEPSAFTTSTLNAGFGEDVDYHTAYSTTDRDGSHIMSGGPNADHSPILDYPFSGVKDSQDPAALSIIAASATNLEAMMPQGTGGHQDQGAMAAARGLISQQSLVSDVPATSRESMISTNPVDDPSKRQRLEPVPGLSTSPVPTLHGPEDGSNHQTHGPMKPHGRAQKIRGKFTDSRRQEVQHIRKKGACIRCRMLRKTCSGESPCKTCASVTSARVWKLDCVRVNIYKELEIFHAGAETDIGSPTINLRAPGVFEARASRLQERWETQGPPEPDQLHTGLQYANTGTSPMPFSARIYKRYRVNHPEDQGPRQQTEESSEVFLNEFTEQISAKLLPHMQASVSHASYEEPDPLIGPTLRLVLKLMQADKDKLLAQTLDLWALTQVMVSSPSDWRLLPDPSSTEAKEQEQPSRETASPDVLNSRAAESLETINAQLRAAAQQRACTISKTIMIDLERRLERKERCQGFETFLIGMIFLNCVERMCWAIRSVSDANEGQDWPVAKPVEYYFDQAARFAEFLSKLYKMRGILVHVRQSPEDGLLHANPTVAPMAERWLGELRLTRIMMEERRAALFDPTNHRCFDFRFCSQLLLVED